MEYNIHISKEDYTRVRLRLRSTMMCHFEDGCSKQKTLRNQESATVIYWTIHKRIAISITNLFRNQNKYLQQTLE